MEYNPQLEEIKRTLIDMLVEIKDIKHELQVIKKEVIELNNEPQ